MSDKKEKFLTRNYILMLLLNCIYGVSQNFITTPLAKQGVAIGLSMTTIGTIASAVTIIAMICRPILWTESILKRFCIWLWAACFSPLP